MRAFGPLALVFGEMPGGVLIRRKSLKKTFLNTIKPGSIFSKLGLRSGDIVQGINGSTIKSPDDILAFYEKLKSGFQVQLEIDRRGQGRTLDYRFR